MKQSEVAEVLRVVQEVEDKVTALLRAVTSCDGRLARMEAMLERLEGPGPEALDTEEKCEGAAVH